MAGTILKWFIEGEARTQVTLLPECLDDYITEENPIRVVDVFVDELDLGVLGFEGVDPAATGRPAYHPAVLLKIYIYGYFNRIQSSRRLEREAERKVELMWLTSRLAPDFKTIADFRRDNGKAIRSVCRQFVVLCRNLNLFSQSIIAMLASRPGSPLCPEAADIKQQSGRRFGKQDFSYIAASDEYRCPADQLLTRRHSSVEDGMLLHSYRFSGCQSCTMQKQCTTGKERRLKRWEHETVVEAMQIRLEHDPGKMKVRRQTVEHPFGTLKYWMGSTHFLTKTLPRVSTEMSLHVLA